MTRVRNGQSQTLRLKHEELSKKMYRILTKGQPRNNKIEKTFAAQKRYSKMKVGQI